MEHEGLLGLVAGSEYEIAMPSHNRPQLQAQAAHVWANYVVDAMCCSCVCNLPNYVANYVVWLTSASHAQPGGMQRKNTDMPCRL